MKKTKLDKSERGIEDTILEYKTVQLVDQKNIIKSIKLLKTAG